MSPLLSVQYFKVIIKLGYYRDPMSILTSSERRIALEMIDRGHTAAAKAFSEITKQLMTARMPVLKTIDSQGSIPIKSRVVKLVTTEVMGEFQGKSFLLLDEEDCNAISQFCLSPTYSDEEREVMNQAIIQEIDNIISASVITEFSNQLQVTIYGDVPHLYSGSADAIKARVREDFSEFGDDGFFFFTNTYFSSENNIRLQPQFLWRLNAEFLQYLKGHSQINSSKP